MNATPHLTDELLEQIITDDQFGTEFANIETHIDSCEQCRARLEALAGDGNWFAQYRESLSSDFHSISSGLSTTDSREAVDSNKEPQDFDKQAIEGMLSDLLKPSIHPENLGQLGGYEVESIIGYGGMGAVLRAYDRNLQRPVAIKLIVPRLMRDGTAKQRFTREARAAATVLHPNVIAIHCIDETNGVPWFVMPLIAGPSLQESVKANGPLHEADITRIGLQIASGLAAAHSHGVVHRDIKPANILVDNHVNRVVITDFGLARQDSDTMITQAGVLAGTLHYMSPEQTRGEELDGRSDLFSLGALLYFLATGSVPFRSDTPVGALHKIANTPHSDVRRLNPEISKTLASAIDRLLEKDRADRFQSSSEVEQFFESLIAHLNQPTQHAPPTVPSRRSPRFFRAVAGTVLAVIACSVFAFWYANRPPITNPAQPTKAAEPAPEELWASLQETHGIAAGFDTDFEELTRELRRLDTSIGEVTDQEETALDDEMNSTQSALRRLSQELEQ